LITNQELRTVYAPSGSDQIDVGTLQQIPPSLPMSMFEGDALQALRGAWLYRRRQIQRRIAAAE